MYLTKRNNPLYFKELEVLVRSPVTAITTPLCYLIMAASVMSIHFLLSLVIVFSLTVLTFDSLAVEPSPSIPIIRLDTDRK